MALPDHKIMLKQLIRDGKRKVRGLNSLDYGLLLNRKKKKNETSCNNNSGIGILPITVKRGGLHSLF